MPRLGGRPASTGNANDVTDKSKVCDLLFTSHLLFNRPLILVVREPGLSDILMHSYTWPFDGMVSVLLSSFGTFTNATNCIKISLDSDSFAE